ncbi:MAG: hypothetical protein KC442_19725 [Thermomicrobiales bacterium]|nr:hypothetical protein [Thermomicrobiales bacterium]MCA9880038.1 hypothetical protein [Thermomicrobiales bacterium]
MIASSPVIDGLGLHALAPVDVLAQHPYAVLLYPPVAPGDGKHVPEPAVDDTMRPRASHFFHPSDASSVLTSATRMSDGPT